MTRENVIASLERMLSALRFDDVAKNQIIANVDQVIGWTEHFVSNAAKAEERAAVKSITRKFSKGELEQFNNYLNLAGRIDQEKFYIFATDWFNKLSHLIKNRIDDSDLGDVYGLDSLDKGNNAEWSLFDKQMYFSNLLEDKQALRSELISRISNPDSDGIFNIILLMLHMSANDAVAEKYEQTYRDFFAVLVLSANPNISPEERNVLWGLNSDLLALEFNDINDSTKKLYLPCMNSEAFSETLSLFHAALSHIKSISNQDYDNARDKSLAAQYEQAQEQVLGLTQKYAKVKSNSLLRGVSNVYKKITQKPVLENMSTKQLQKIAASINPYVSGSSDPDEESDHFWFNARIERAKDELEKRAAAKPPRVKQGCFGPAKSAKPIYKSKPDLEGGNTENSDNSDPPNYGEESPSIKPKGMSPRKKRR